MPLGVIENGEMQGAMRRLDTGQKKENCHLQSYLRISLNPLTVEKRTYSPPSKQFTHSYITAVSCCSKLGISSHIITITNITASHV